MTVVVFDLDDTLYKEREYLRSGCRAVAAGLASQYGFDASELLDVIETPESASEGFDNLIALINSQLKDRGGVQPAPLTISEILDIYRNHVPTLELPEESRIVLDTLHSRDIPLGIITDGRSFAQRAKMRALGIEKYFRPENIIISQEIGSDKNSPVPFETIMSRFGRQSEYIGQLSESVGRQSKYVYVGDNPQKDFLWPNRLGWLTVQLLDSDNQNIHKQNIHPSLPTNGEYQPRIQINSLTELLHII